MNLVETFERLDANGIAEFIRLGQEENLHLEFKTVSSANLRGNDDKRNLAKCLSGFANSDGGIIVWGVNARKNAQGIDCAGAAAEIAPIKLFLSRLNELTGDAVSPVVDGIRHKPIEVGRDAGFAVTLVPESNSGPYMAKLGEDRYYKRSGDSFYRMEHFDLEDMFGRRQKPQLQFRLKNLLVGGTREEIQFVVQNVGRGIARHVGFWAKFENIEIVQLENLNNISHLNEGRTVISYDSEGVVHPNGIPTVLGRAWILRKNSAENIAGEITFYCENAQTRKELVTLAAQRPPVEAAPQ